MRSVRRPLALVVGISLVMGALVACSGEGQRRPAPAGRQPLPSSEPPRALPGAGGRSRPMFADPISEDRTKALAGTRMMREARAREEAMEKARGPVRIGGEQERGRQLAEQMAQAAAAADPADPCEQAWAAQSAMREQMHVEGGATRQDYLRACRDLPEADRNCMSPQYLRDHAEECERVQTESMERLQRQGRMARTQRDLP